MAGIAVILGGSTAFAQQPTVTVQGTLAPNAYGSPSFDAWSANAIQAIELGLSTYGAAGPAQFNTDTTTQPTSHNVVTGFPSWLGNANPAATFGSAYANELGDRATFDVLVNGNGQKISLANLAFNSVSSDPGNNLGFGWGPTVPNPYFGPFTEYDPYDIGLIFNQGGGVTVINSGPATQLVDELISVGAGDAYDAYLSDPGTSPQNIIDSDLANGTSRYPAVESYTYTGTWLMTDGTDVLASASDTLSFSAPDSGSTIALFSGAFIALNWLRRRLA